MPRPAIVLLALLIAAFLAPSAFAQRAVILVRHAEKETDPQRLKAAGVDPERLRDPQVDLRIPLSEAGKARAEALARALDKAGIATIHTSQADRTKQTARPLATALGIESKPLERRQIGRLGVTDQDRIVLIVGHSNTIPQIIDEITGRSNRVEIDDDDFQSLFILLPGKDGSWGLIRSRY